jgi:hypothetical protein
LLTKSDLIGSWKLEGSYEDLDGVIGVNPNFGENPVGFLHYTAEDRVAVIIASGGRKKMAGAHRRRASVEDLAEAARTFDAYAGRFTFRAPDQIIHHIEANSYENDVGRDFVRRIELDGDRLTLHVPPDEPDAGKTSKRWHEWRRITTPLK